jgi:hypothetical protein
MRDCRLCGKPSIRSVCAYCSVRLRRMRVKLAAIAYKGGKCERCGYDKCPWVLEFHHRDQGDKAFTIGASCHMKSWRSVVAEIEKCDLLCANCHREEHGSNSFKDALMEEVLRINRIVQPEIRALLARHPEAREEERIRIVELTCLHCSVSFRKPRRKRVQRFCSQRCSGLHYGGKTVNRRNQHSRR